MLCPHMMERLSELSLGMLLKDSGDLQEGSPFVD